MHDRGDGEDAERHGVAAAGARVGVGVRTHGQVRGSEKPQGGGGLLPARGSRQSPRLSRVLRSGSRVRGGGQRRVGVLLSDAGCGVAVRERKGDEG